MAQRALARSSFRDWAAEKTVYPYKVCEAAASARPEVGTFWLIDNKLVADPIPFPQAVANGAFYRGKNDHAASWTTLQRLLPQWKSVDYTDYPRGRVLFDSMEEVFLVYSSRGIISGPALRNLIITEFKLPLVATKFAADYHYENVVASLLDEDFDA